MTNLNDKLKLGVLLPTRRLVMEGEPPKNIDVVLSMAQQVEDAGLDSVWVGDSLTAKPRLEPLSTLAAVAMCTSRVRLGTAVLLPALRQPVLLAQTAATLDLISEGRTLLGVGVGGAFNDAQRHEWQNAGVDPTRRASRFDETLEIMKRLTKGESVTHHGKHFDVDDVQVAPASVQSNGVPLIVATHWRAGRESQFKRAARIGDGVISISDYPDEYAKVLERVRAYADEYGRNQDDIEPTFYMTVNMNRDEKRAFEDADRFLHLYYGMNMWGDRWGPYGAPGRIVERINQYREAGAHTVIVRFASLEQDRQLDTFLSEVAPNF